MLGGNPPNIPVPCRESIGGSPLAIINGNPRDNRLIGTSSADQILGFAGNDTLMGLRGADRLFGGAGDDLLDGGPGLDVLNGGAGHDMVTYAGTARPIAADLALGVIEYRSGNRIADRIHSIEGVIGSSGDDYIMGNAERNELHGGDGNDDLDGRVGADLLFGGAGDDWLAGGLGSDTIDGGAGSDSLNGDGGETDVDGSSNAVAIGRAKPDTVSFASGTAGVTLTLGEGDEETTATHAGSEDVDSLQGFDNVIGSSGADRITGNSGDNLLIGGRGNDILIGGAGDDTLAGGAGTDRLDGGAGRDTIDYSENTNALRLDLATQTVTFPGKTWTPEVFKSIENATTGSGNDTLLGDSGANVLDGGLGSDLIRGGAGHDTVSYASHDVAVSVSLLTGVGTIIGSNVRDRLIGIENITGGDGNDLLRGSAGANVLDGGDGNDTVIAGAGNDTIHLTAGSDIINGGAGSDTVVVDLGYDAYPDLDFSEWWDESNGLATVTYDGGTEVDLLADLANGRIISYTGPAVRGRLTNVENVTTGAGNDIVIGSDAANVISVGHGANVVDAGRGNDLILGSNTQTEWSAWGDYEEKPDLTDARDAGEVLRGGMGADTIVGGMSMFGQGGDDRLVAALVDGETRMSGGRGADSFVFSDKVESVGWHETYLRVQHVTITDFDGGEGDRIIIERADPDSPDPVFVGTVTDRNDIDVGEWGFHDDKLFIGLAYEAFSGNDYEQTPGGLDITILGGNISESDVLFV